MDKLKEMFKGKDKKTLVNLSMAFVAGIVLLLASGIISSGTGNKNPADPNTAAVISPEKVSESAASYERELEKRLEEALELIDGAGKVKVMLTLANGREIIVAENIDQNSKTVEESDNDGGARTTEELRIKSDKIILSQRSGESEPLILKELSPKVEGAIIIAQGAADIMVKDALTRATQAALGIEIHKIQVLKMKTM